MIWYEQNGSDIDVVLSSRVRIARNIVDYPFPDRIESESATELISRIEQALGEGYKRTDMLDTDSLSASVLVEKHMISPAFAKSGGERALFLSNDSEVAIMACEEDHIRIQSILGGYELDRAFSLAYEAEKLLDSSLPFAFDSKLGYLTHCPTNLGTALRISVMVFLPALTHLNMMPSISEMLPKLGLTLRGIYGEGSGSEGCIYQISNQVTMGIDESQTLSRMTEAINSIIARERKCREQLRNEANQDRIMRSLGQILYATLMPSAEFERHYTNLRLGSALGYIDIQPGLLDKLYIMSKSACIAKLCAEKNKDNTPQLRDSVRAEYLRSELAFLK